MKTSKLITTACYNPFFLNIGNDNKGEIGKISFFDSGVIIATIDKGWFGNSNNLFKEITLNHEVKIKRKENLTKKEFFALPYKDMYNNRKIHLYLNISLLDSYTAKNSIQEYKTKQENVFKDIISFHVLGVKMIRELNEKKECIWVRKSDNYKVNVSFNYKFIKNSLGEKIENLRNRAKEININLSSYTIERLLEIFDITIK